jgi:hypothetical protein
MTGTSLLLLFAAVMGLALSVTIGVALLAVRVSDALRTIMLAKNALLTASIATENQIDIVQVIVEGRLENALSAVSVLENKLYDAGDRTPRVVQPA